MTYLLDSNVWVSLLRCSSQTAVDRFRAADPSALRVCSIVVAELRYGCTRSARPAANRAAVDALLAPYPSLPYDDGATDSFVTLRRHLESLGQVIGPYDMQIAAIALANGTTLVTHNKSEFGRIPGLMPEDWQQP